VRFSGFALILIMFSTGCVSGVHHGFTHSLVFALLVGTLAALMSRCRSVQGFVAFSAATASHTLIDYTWGSTSFWDAAINILRISLIEFMIFAPVLLLVVLLKRVSKKHSIIHQ
jgi:hypothetical protein